MTQHESNQADPLPPVEFLRSPLLVDRNQSALLIVDVQEKLLPSIRNHQRITWNIGRLVDGARLLGVAVAATEQYPKGLGPTVASIRQRLGDIPEKLTFSCRECHSIFDDWQRTGIRQIVLAGIETHVCVLQTALDVIQMGFDAYVVVDATGSRFEIDEQIGLRRIEQSGGWTATTESVLFEWCEVAGSESFKGISQLVRQMPPVGH